jgi:hypothetical protein
MFVVGSFLAYFPLSLFSLTKVEWGSVDWGQSFVPVHTSFFTLFLSILNFWVEAAHTNINVDKMEPN